MDVIFFAIVTSIGMFMAYHSGKFSMVKQVLTVSKEQYADLTPTARAIKIVMEYDPYLIEQLK